MSVKRKITSVGSSGAILKINGATAAVRIYSETTDPTISNDIGEGYSIGSLAINTNTNNVFICVDNTAGAAVWKSFTKDKIQRLKKVQIVSNTPPGSPSVGDRYIDTDDNHIYEYDGSWTDVLTPEEGMIVFNDDDNFDYIYVDDGTPAWEQAPIQDHIHASISTDLTKTESVVTATDINSVAVIADNTSSPNTKMLIKDQDIGGGGLSLENDVTNATVHSYENSFVMSDGNPQGLTLRKTEKFLIGRINSSLNSASYPGGNQHLTVNSDGSSLMTLQSTSSTTVTAFYSTVQVRSTTESHGFFAEWCLKGHLDSKGTLHACKIDVINMTEEVAGTDDFDIEATINGTDLVFQVTENNTGTAFDISGEITFLTTYMP